MNAKRKSSIHSALVSLLVIIAGCHDPGSKPSDLENPANTQRSETELPYIGEYDIEFHQNSDGTTVADTVQYTIPKFSFINQDGIEISHHNYENKIFVVDFFFTECPTICPILSSQMARLQVLAKKEGLEKEVMFLSHTVKPEHDTSEVLKAYGEKLGADFTNWNFVTGKAEDIYDLAENGYMLSAFPSDSAAGGIFHTEKITLVDRDMHIRGVYDGTSTISVDQLFSDIKKLQKDK